MLRTRMLEAEDFVAVGVVRHLRSTIAPTSVLIIAPTSVLIAPTSVLIIAPTSVLIAPASALVSESSYAPTSVPAP
eukprot:1324993-Rhodomonas_salina.1